MAPLCDNGATEIVVDTHQYAQGGSCQTSEKYQGIEVAINRRAASVDAAHQ